MLKKYTDGLVGKFVPLAIGALVTWLAVTVHVIVDPKTEAALSALCVAVVSALVAALLHLLAKRYPRLAGLLGEKVAPVTPAVVAPKPAPVLDPGPPTAPLPAVDVVSQLDPTAAPVPPTVTPVSSIVTPPANPEPPATPPTPGA